MSQNLRNGEESEESTTRPVSDNSYQFKDIGFDGMNYEQFREPYHTTHRNRNSTTGERSNGQPPNES
ncbi:MAG TPA: hypothetical protein VM884_07260 [Flavisolibacter sp.]|nr:hypothetical protein [Flavisolibacter sp.]